MSESLTPELIRDIMSKERVMLVGGAGFIGHHLALELRAHGVDTLVLDNLMQNNIVANVSSGGLDPFRRALYHRFLLDRFTAMREAGVAIVNADARSLADLSWAIHNYQPTHIVHLSAIASALEAKKDPGYCFDLQLITLRNVLELARSNSCIKHVMLISSSTVYGDFETPTVDETTRPQPRGIYANTKYMSERLVRTYADQYGLATTIVRPSALYGERCISGRVSQAFIENALRGKPLLLEGGGSGRLDFTHISDLVNGMVRGLAYCERMGQKPYTNTYNLTFGNARTIADLAAVVKDVIPEAILEDRPRDDNKPVRGTLSIERAREQLNFVPSQTLETGYRRYCQWYVDQWRAVQAEMKL